MKMVIVFDSKDEHDEYVADSSSGESLAAIKRGVDMALTYMLSENNSMIDFVKRIREETGCSLKEAADLMNPLKSFKESLE